MLKLPAAKIRIFSDIFTKFASWIIKRKTAIKRLIKIFWRVIVALSCILFAVSLCIQLPQVQTFVADRVVKSVSETLDGDISFEKIHLKPFTTLVLKNVLITDRNPVQNPHDSLEAKVDTFFRAEYIIAKFTLDGLTRHEGIILNKAYITDAQMNLVIEDGVDEDDTDNLSRIFRIQESEETEQSSKELFYIKKVEIRNMGFAMKNYESDREEYAGGGIDWNDLDVLDINLNAKGLRFKGGVMSGKMNRMSFREKSGFIVENINGTAKVGNGRTIVEDLHIKDTWSVIDMPVFMMTYDDVYAFETFISSVKIDANIAESHLDFKTLGYFAPELANNGLISEISGHVSGYVDNFSVSDLRINSADGGFKGKVSGSLSGLPDIQSSYLKARFDDFVVTTDGIGKFVSHWMEDGETLDISNIAKGTAFTLNARTSGMMNRMNVYAAARSKVGKADINVLLENVVNPNKNIIVSGDINTKDLNIGKFIKTDILGPTTLKAKIEANLGNDLSTSELKISRLEVQRMYANDYDYTNIGAVGDISSNTFKGKIICNDPNLNFMFEGAFALSSKTQNARYQFYANLGYADLNALNIDKRGVSKVNMTANANFTKINTGNVRGKIDIGGITLQNSLGKYRIGDINLNSYNSDSTYTINLDSKFAKGSYYGSAPVTTFFKDLRNITLKQELPALFRDTTFVWNGNSYGIDFRFYNSMDLLSFVAPGMYIDEGTQLKMRLEKNGRFDAKLNSNRLAFRKNYLKGLKADFSNADTTLNGLLNCSEVKVASVTLRDSHFEVHGKDNHVGVKFDYDNASQLRNSGEIIMHSAFERKDDGLGIEVEFLPSAVFVNSKEWNMLPSAITYKNNVLDVSKFAVVSGDERITVTGKASTENADTLNLNLERFDISIAEYILRKDIGIKGVATGVVQLTSPLKKRGILVDMICDSTYLANKPLGTLNIASKWNEAENNFGLVIRNEYEGRSNINAYGTYKPEGSILDIATDLDKFSISYAQPMLSDVFSEMEGNISGNIDLSGPISNLAITSNDTRLEDGLLKVAYTNVPYKAEGTFHLDETGAHFDDFKIRDNYTGTGTITGSINWDRLRNMTFNTSISIDELEGINILESNNDGVYGRVFGTGNISLTGPMNSILLSIDAVTAKEGQLHIPLSNEATGKAANLLKFKEIQVVQRIDPYEAMMVKMDEMEKVNSDFTVKLRINAQPQVEAFIEIDKATGNVLSGYGNGLIDLEIGSDRFNINGDYLLNGGSYKFVAMGLVTRDFQIQDGSSIKFNGDIMNSNLDINAIYRTKASLSSLLSDENSVSNKRNVDCLISITGKISNPEFGFDIDVPDLNPMIKSRVESALSTDDKIQKQFLSLILSNSFLPDEQSGIVNNTTLLYSNVTEALANQLNNIFHKLDIPLDLGLNYQPNESGNDIFDVAVSTQLFNNRVVVNGNIGNKQYTTSGSQNDVVGDLDIEIKLNRSGAFRLNLFSHSADQFSNYLDNTQRNGVGIMYQTEFNSFGKFMKSIFSSKAKRQAFKMEEEQEMIQDQKVTFNIKAPEDKTE